MSLYTALEDLPVRIDSVALEGLEARVSPTFVRRTTLVRLRGGGHEGVGEDVCYDGEDQLAFQRHFEGSGLAGERSLDELSERLGTLALHPRAPRQEAYRDYRRWAFESAALDLALRQAGRSLPEHLGREPRPLRFVVSLGLGEPPSAARIESLLARRPELRFKLDATPGWKGAFLDRLAALAAVDVIDFKGAYRGTPVDQPADPELYRAVAGRFPDAWLEDPHDEPAVRAALRGHEARITWDAPLHSVADIATRWTRPRCVNVKPSRFGSLRRLFEVYDSCAREGIAMYGGGQFELGPGRGQIQLLAALFHADAPNDVAPGVYNAPDPAGELPPSPLRPGPVGPGFVWPA